MIIDFLFSLMSEIEKERMLLLFLFFSFFSFHSFKLELTVPSNLSPSYEVSLLFKVIAIDHSSQLLLCFSVLLTCLYSYRGSINRTQNPQSLKTRSPYSLGEGSIERSPIFKLKGVKQLD